MTELAPTDMVVEVTPSYDETKATLRSCFFPEPLDISKTPVPEKRPGVVETINQFLKHTFSGNTENVQDQVSFEKPESSNGETSHNAEYNLGLILDKVMDHNQQKNNPGGITVLDMGNLGLDGIHIEFQSSNPEIRQFMQIIWSYEDSANYVSPDLRQQAARQGASIKDKQSYLLACKEALSNLRGKEGVHQININSTQLVTNNLKSL